jgi:AcrR family transcriptional regulator
MDTNTSLPSSTQLSREQILAVTAQSLQQHGYDGTTIRRIASMLGCAVGSIYRYFTDKRELLAAVTELTLEPVAVMAEAGESFDATVRQYYHAASHAPQTYRLMFWLASETPTDGDGVDPTRLPVVVQRIIAAWDNRLGGIERARRSWAVMHGMLTLSVDIDVVLRAVSVAGDLTVADRPAAQPVLQPTHQPQVVVTAPQLPTPQPRVAAPAPTANTDTDADPAVDAEDVCLL